MTGGGGVTIGIDLGGTSFRAGLVDAAGTVLRRISEPTRRERTETLLDQILAAVSDLMSDDVLGVCVAIPGSIDARDGTVTDGGINIPLVGTPLAAWLQERVGVPVVAERDSNAAAVAEAAYGAGRGCRNLLLLTLGTGVGGAAIVDGVVLQGAVGSGGELGHFTLESGGRPCLGVCRGRGHLEAYASGTAIGLEAERVAGVRPDGDLGRARARGVALDGRAVVDLAAAGPGDARAVIEEAGFYLGLAIESLANIFNPGAIVIGGSVADAGELLLGPASRVVEERGLHPQIDVMSLSRVALGGDAGVIGAAVLARPDSH